MLTTKLTAIANAIRAKTGKTGTMKLDEMPGEIAAIETGITPTGSISITENGTYDVTAKAQAVVNIPQQNIKMWTYTMASPQASKEFVMINDPDVAAHYADENAVALLVKMTNKSTSGLNFAFCGNKVISDSYENFMHIYGNFNGNQQNVNVFSHSSLSAYNTNAGKLTAYENGNLSIYSATVANVVRAGEYLLVFAW